MNVGERTALVDSGLVNLVKPFCACLHASDALEKGSTSSIQKNGGADISHTNVNPEYSRYLDLHAQFEGDAKRKLLRKRSFYPPRKLTALSSPSSWRLF
jgi:hypothetical protein